MTIPNYDQEIERRGHPENFVGIRPKEFPYEELLTPAHPMQRVLEMRAWKQQVKNEIMKILKGGGIPGRYIDIPVIGKKKRFHLRFDIMKMVEVIYRTREKIK